MSNKFYTRLFLRDIEFDQLNQIFFYKRKEIENVCVLGNVTYIRKKEKYLTFHVDDLTSSFPCVHFYNKSSFGSLSGLEISEVLPLQGELTSTQSAFLDSLDLPSSSVDSICLGDLVEVRGKLNVFNGSQQIICYHLRPVDDPNEIWFRIREIKALREI